MEIGPGVEIIASTDEHPGLIGPLTAARDRGVDDLAGRRGLPTRSAETTLVACSHINWRPARSRRWSPPRSTCR